MVQFYKKKHNTEAIDLHSTKDKYALFRQFLI